MTNAVNDNPRKAAARAREAAAPYVDEITARGVERQDMPRQNPPAVEDAPPGVTEINPGYMKLYKRVDYGWMPKRVSRGSVEACVESGAFRFECGDCGGHCGSLPNDCPARTPIKFTRCPVRTCRKQMWDTAENLEGLPEPDDDPNEVRMPDLNQSTPESRLRVKLNRHLRFAHLSTAEELGVGADPFLVPGAHQIAATMQPVVPHPVHPADRPPAAAGA